MGSLSDVFGRRKVLLISSVVFASAPFCYIFVTTWWHLILVRFYHGFATAIFVPVARATITDHYTARKGERIATFTSATIVGRGIAPEVENARSLLRTSDRGSLPRQLNSGSGWKMVLQHGGILVTSATEAAARYVHGALEFFFIGYLNNVAQLDPSLIGIIMGVQFLLIPILSPFLGRMSDRIGRIIPIVAGLLLSGIPILFIPSATGFLPLFVISLLYGVGFVTVISSTPALVTDLTQHGAYGAAMGFLATIMDVGQMLGPIVTGFVLASTGYSGSFWSLSAILLSVVLVFIGYNKFRVLKRAS
jgi:MFS family permease